MKYLLIAFTLATFSLYLPCYCTSAVEKVDRHDESLSLVYIGCGNDGLKLQKFSSAIEDFQKASALLGEREDHPVELDVLILFGQVIAYDNVGLKEDCLGCLSKLKSIIHAENEMESSTFFYDYNDFSLEEYQEAVETNSDLYHLASLSCSQEVQEELFTMIHKMFEDVQGQLCIGHNLDFPCKSTKSQEKVELCKAKWIKKLEKIARRVYKVFRKVKEVWRFVQEVDEACNAKNKKREQC